MKTRWLLFIVVVVVAAGAILAGCGPKVIPPEELAEMDGEDPTNAMVMMRYKRLVSRHGQWTASTREEVSVQVVEVQKKLKKEHGIEMTNFDILGSISITLPTDMAQAKQQPFGYWAEEWMKNLAAAPAPAT